MIRSFSCSEMEGFHILSFCMCASVALFEAIYNFLSICLEQIYEEVFHLFSALAVFSFPFLFSLFFCTTNNAFLHSQLLLLILSFSLRVELFLPAIKLCKNCVTHMHIITYNFSVGCRALSFVLGFGFFGWETNYFWPPSQ